MPDQSAHVPPQSREHRRVYQFFDALMRTAIDVLTGTGMAPDAAESAAREIAQRVAMQYGRTNLYVPAALDIGLSQRDERIYELYKLPSPTAAAYTAARVAELANEFRLTEVRIYQVVKVGRQREQARLQPKLFDDDV